MILFFLSDPKEHFVELFEFLEDGPFPAVFVVVVGDQDSSVDHVHDELGVVLVFRKNNRLLLLMPLVFYL